MRIWWNSMIFYDHLTKFTIFFPLISLLNSLFFITITSQNRQFASTIFSWNAKIVFTIILWNARFFFFTIFQNFLVVYLICFCVTYSFFISLKDNHNHIKQLVHSYKWSDQTCPSVHKECGEGSLYKRESQVQRSKTFFVTMLLTAIKQLGWLDNSVAM